MLPCRFAAVLILLAPLAAPLQAQPQTQTQAQAQAQPQTKSKTQAQTQTAAGMHPMAAPTKAIPSTSLTVTVDGKSVTYTLAQLQAMPQRAFGVRNMHLDANESYSGVGLDDLLARFGITLANGGAERIYHSYVRAEGTDHYFAIFGASELQPGIHPGDSMIALMQSGRPLGEDGQFKLIVAGELKTARWVRNLTSLTFVTVP